MYTLGHRVLCQSIRCTGSRAPSITLQERSPGRYEFDTGQQDAHVSPNQYNVVLMVQGTVGLGGVYLCIYPMNSPGGYQLVGRSLPIWNSFCTSASFQPGKPWLLEIFDQIRFHEVTEEELTQQRRDFKAGSLHIEVTEEVFDFAEHKKFCDSIAPQVETLRKRQAAAAAEVMVRDAEILARLEAAGYIPGGGNVATAGDANQSHDQYDGDQFEKVWWGGR